ncbi:MAG: hydroxyacid dehydrogenase [Synergistetes bacterium]|nr:hydroxyacid dehydrogenase [Synergistota bacterium]MDW8191658.1 hydroxyacid dehydrogenase [Synergistota bacterium]
MEKRKLLLMQEIHPDGLKMLEESGIDYEVSSSLKEDHILNVVGEYDGIIVRVTPYISRRIIQAAKRCLVIGKHGALVDNVDLDAANEFRIPVVYAPGSNANAVAEHTVALMLAVAKHIWDANVEFRYHGNYSYRLQVKSIELLGKTLGVIGLGNIGRKVARICRYGFSMKVIGYDPYITEEILEREGLRDVELTQDLDYLLRTSDFVTIHIPAVKETEKFIGERELSLMKKSAILINTARGSVIDQRALYNALKDGVIAGAGLDVYDPEPPSADEPLLKLPNVVATPHMAAHTEETLSNMARMVCKNVIMVLKGERPDNIANPQIWEIRKR